MAANQADLPDALLQALGARSLDPMFWRPDRIDVESAWYGHVPFAHWIVSALAPRCIVELGSHNGVSYSAFCRAVEREGSGTRCFAIDTWTGDEQAGFYDESVFNDLRAYHDTRFSAFSTLIRSRFDDALPLLADGSIDLLHIDGQHGYDAVSHDFETWRCKLSDRGVVLLHDIAEFRPGFGVWQLWVELRARFPHFEFVHAHGLGVLAVGSECPPVVAALAGLRDARAIGVIRERFARLGERCTLEYQAQRLARQNERQTCEHKAVQAQWQVSQAALEAAQSELDSIRQELAESRAAARADHERLHALTSPIRQAQLANLQRRAEAEAALHRIQQSWLWRTGAPVRAGLARLPFPLRRPATGVLRTIWRILTPELDELRRPLHADLEAATPPTAHAPGPPTNLRICYVSGEPNTPGADYRVHRYAEACKAIGAFVTVLRSDELASRLPEADQVGILIIWRAVWNEALASFVSAARLNGARVVFDVDDLMIDPALVSTTMIDGIRSQSHDEDQVRLHFTLVQRSMLEADFCTTTTDELAGQIRRFARSCFVLPNGFDADTLRVSRIAARRRLAAPDDGLLRLGYATGSRTHQKDFAAASGALCTVLAAHPACRLVLFRQHDVELVELNEFPELLAFADQIEWRELVPLAQLPNEVARFDINLAPLQAGNLFCAAKSELKYFEAALAGVCTVASPVGPYTRVIRHGRNGFLAATPAEWEKVLTRLLNDPALRRQAAQTALNEVLWIYGPDRRAQQMRRVLAEWQGGAAAADAFMLEIAQPGGAEHTGPVVPAGEIMFSVDRLRTAEVTVAVPLYNYAHTVIDTLESVRAQSLRLLDLIIVDDRSTDRSLDTALGWATRNADRFNRLLVIRNQANGGVGLCRNAAFAAAETTYVLPLDADNLLRPTCCELLLAALHKSRAAYAYPVIQEFGGRSGLIGNAPYHPSRFIGGNYIDAMALIARSAWSAAGGYAQLRAGWEDYDFWCALAERGLSGCAVGGAALADYRVHDRSLLAQVTDTADVKDRVIAEIERRHPWVTVARPVEVAGKAATSAQARPGQRLHVVGGGVRDDKAARRER